MTSKWATTWMSQEVSKWLVKWVSSPTYKWGILGIITPTDPPITFNLCRTNRHPTKGRVVRVATAPKTNEGHVAFRGSKIPKGLSPQFCQAKGDFSKQTPKRFFTGHKTGTMQGTQRNSQKIWGPHHAVIYENRFGCVSKVPKFEKFHEIRCGCVSRRVS